MLPDEQTLRTTVRPDFFRGPVDWVRVDAAKPPLLRERAKTIAALVGACFRAQTNSQRTL